MPDHKFDEEDLKKRLTSDQYAVTQESATERPYTGEHLDNKLEGVYHCVVCHEMLFKSDAKYDSGSGWPSFYQPHSEKAILTEQDTSLGQLRTEILCNSCGAHLGHVFEDGPEPTGMRYCVNSASLEFEQEA